MITEAKKRWWLPERDPLVNVGDGGSKSGGGDGSDRMGPDQANSTSQLRDTT